MLKPKNINYISNLKNMLINMTKIAFVITVFTIKNVINIFKKNIIFDRKSMQVKNLAKNIKKNVTQILFIR